MNKNINNVVELTEKELACVCGGGVPPEVKKRHMEEIDRRIKKWHEDHQPRIGPLDRRA